MQHPLIFLTVRSFVNGLRRALTSPKRLIGLIGVTLYYVSFLGRQLFVPSRGAAIPSGETLQMPPLASVQAVVFLAFSGLTLMLVLQTFNYRGGFKPADVDVLFPTPVDPKVVLVFRMFRDYLLTLLIPLFFMLISWRPTAQGLQYMVRNFPQSGGYVFRAASLAWILVAMTWVAIGYAMSLFVNRSDSVSARNRKVIGWSVFTVAAFLALFSAVSIRGNPTWAGAVGITESPLIRLLLFTATAATQIVMAPLTGHYLTGFIAGASLIALILAAVRVALTQVGWMYDQAAARGFDSITYARLRRAGDSHGIVVEQARRGRIRSNRLSRLISNKTASGPKVLIWKELVLQTRTSFPQNLILIIAGAVMASLPVWAMSQIEKSEAGLTYLVFLSFFVFMMANGSQAGFVELLRRVDLLKPLPFTPATIVFWEVAGKTIPVLGLTLVSSASCVLIRPDIWPYALCSLFAAPFFSLTLISAVLLVTVLFPDVDDPTQRAFRGLMLLLGIAVVSLPSIGVFGLMIYFGISPLIAAIPFSALNIGITLAIASVAGSLYATYNPSE